MRFLIRIECHAWPYDYPPTDLLVEACDEDDARRKAIEYDKWADILSVRCVEGDSNGGFCE